VTKSENAIIFTVHQLSSHDTMQSVARACGGLPEDIIMMNRLDQVEEDKYRAFHHEHDLAFLPTAGNQVSYVPQKSTCTPHPMYNAIDNIVHHMYCSPIVYLHPTTHDMVYKSQSWTTIAFIHHTKLVTTLILARRTILSCHSIHSLRNRKALYVAVVQCNKLLHALVSGNNDKYIALLHCR
jgi:hypothetical protein